jgi:hypothetical protein
MSTASRGPGSIEAILGLNASTQEPATARMLSPWNVKIEKFERLGGDGRRKLRCSP